MSQNRPERPPTAQFLAALRVKRNALIGLVVGTLFAATLLAVFVLPAPVTRADPMLYVGLAFVVAVTVGAMVAVLLTIYSAVKLSRELAVDEGA
ncbi:DUF7536 family protein [Natronobiforma cellulositropha]|uniref:DUF7536 family protein n=1 Tax=Natronobiforma cellulositropha TaxID=1679076 RepID=UPI0021D5E4FD|nr:hypothetical protein [Natronobiforma cellulositropha]